MKLKSKKMFKYLVVAVMVIFSSPCNIYILKINASES